jgi:hypothetical protein
LLRKTHSGTIAELAQLRRHHEEAMQVCVCLFVLSLSVLSFSPVFPLSPSLSPSSSSLRARAHTHSRALSYPLFLPLSLSPTRSHARGQALECPLCLEDHRDDMVVLLPCGNGSLCVYIGINVVHRTQKNPYIDGKQKNPYIDEKRIELTRSAVDAFVPSLHKVLVRANAACTIAKGLRQMKRMQVTRRAASAPRGGKAVPHAIRI